MLMTHILAELYDCPDIINDAEALAEAAKTAARSVGATIVGEYEVRYVPHGLTIAVFLGESPHRSDDMAGVSFAARRYPSVQSGYGSAGGRGANPEQICPEGQMIVHEVPRRIAAKACGADD